MAMKVVEEEKDENKNEDLEIEEEENEVEETIEEKKSKSYFQKEFDSFLSASFEETNKEDFPQIFIPSQIKYLDTILGGGLPNKIMTVVGSPGSGKTALAIKFLAAGQKLYGEKFLCAYLDTEEVTDTARLEQLGVYGVKAKNDITIEKMYQIIAKLAAFKEEHKDLLQIPSMVVLDSLANCNVEKAIEQDNVDSLMGLKARTLSFLLPKIVQLLNKYNISFVVVNQLRDKIDIGGPYQKKPNLLKWIQEEIPGGRSALYNTSQLIHLKAGQDLKDEYGFSGLRVTARTIKNKFFTPNIPISLIFSFKNGFSDFYTNYELLKEEKRVTSSAWCKLLSCPTGDDGKPLSFRQNNVLKLYKTNEKFRNCFNNDVTEILTNIKNSSSESIETDFE